MIRLNVKLIKKEFLPFSDSEWQKEINKENIEMHPESFLENI